MSKLAAVPSPNDNPLALASVAANNYAGSLKRYLSRRVRQHQDLDDLVQQVYMKLLGVCSTTDVDVPLRFIYSVASKVIADHWATSYRESKQFPYAGDVREICANLPSDSLADHPEEQLAVEQTLKLALETVSPMQAAVVILIDRDKMSQDEVAEELGISAHTVKKYATQARARIRLNKHNAERRAARPTPRNLRLYD